MHPRDAEILALARALLGPRTDFVSAVEALETAVVRTIPAGRVYLLGWTGHGPIVGSLISGVGVAQHREGVDVVRVRDGQVERLAAMTLRERVLSAR